MPDISVFDSIQDIEHSDNVSLEAYLKEVKEGRWQDMALNVRMVTDKKRRDAMKSTLPGVTFSGLFSSRKDDCLIQHSGYICIDLDDLGDDVDAIKELLINDKYVYSCFTSISGNGLRVLFRVNGAKHRESYYGISAYLLRNYGLITDPQSMVPSRSFYVTYDPYLYLASHHVPMFTDYPKERVIRQPENFAFAENDFLDIIRQITQQKVNLCEDYQDWLKTGFALAHKFGEDGRTYFHSVSQMSEKYNQRQCDKQFSYCLKHKSMKVATIASFYWICKQAGLQVTSERTQKVRKITLNGKAAGLRKEQIIENLKKDGITDVEKIVEDVFDVTVDSVIGESLIEKLEIYISNSYTLKRNEITRYIERFPGRIKMHQEDFNTIYIAAKKILQNIDYQLMERLLRSDFIPTYNPLIEYFEGLGGPWKNPILPPMAKNCDEYKSPIIDRLASTIINADKLHTEYFLRKWIVSIVASAFKTHSPLVFVLLGKQNTGKTEWFRRLLPKEINDYYAESKLEAGKDDDILMCQRLIIMDDEMAGKNKKETDRLKELTSKQWFSLREPYGRSNVDLLRIAVMCGTSNVETILQDETGNRRIIPILVSEIDKPLLNSIDRTELFREAYQLLNNGFDWRIIDKLDIDFLNKNNFRFKASSAEEEFIDKYFLPSNNDEWMGAAEIKNELEVLTEQKFSSDKIGKQLKRLGFEQKGVYNQEMRNTIRKWGVKRVNRFGGSPPIIQPLPPSSSPF